MFVSGQVAVSSIDTWNMDSMTFQKRLHHAIQPNIFNEANQKKIQLLPATESFISIDSAISYRGSAGFLLETKLGKFYSRTQALLGWNTTTNYTQSQAGFQPLNNHQQQFFTDVRCRLVYDVNHYFTVQGGIDNLFIGEGHRSLFQGNQTAPAPFVNFKARFLNLEYGLIYQFLHDNNLINNTLDWKYLTSHYLSWNAFRNFNVTLYESVVYRGKDGNYQRGYDVEYLNPFVFYRPQEYSLGSTDNVFMGLQVSYLIKKHQVYGQLSLDEFDFGEIKNRTRWWANKYGAQLGIKGKINPKINYRLEGNLVRPYTYSHITSGQNTGNLGVPVGHYLGSNFAEILGMIGFNKSHFRLQSYVQFVLKGYDTDSISWGGDIYQSYVTRPSEYGHRIGQGQTVRTLQIGGQVLYSIEKLHLEAYLQLGATYLWGERKEQLYPTTVFGLRSNLFQARRIF
jgi:hypothetical protein